MTKITIDALFDGNNLPARHSCSLVASADVIVAVGETTPEDSQVVYGRQVVEELNYTGTPYQPTWLDVELDMKTDDLERLCALVQMIKGGCDAPLAVSNS